MVGLIEDFNAMYGLEALHKWEKKLFAIKKIPYSEDGIDFDCANIRHCPNAKTHQRFRCNVWLGSSSQ